MQQARDVLTPESLSMLQAIADAGSFAAAARTMGMVPSALTYRVRQIEDVLDVLLFDRSARHARPTPAGLELLREGQHILQAVDSMANRVKRVATGWEPQLTIAADSIISKPVLLELCESFFALAPSTRLRLREEVLSGTLEALTCGLADLAIGVADISSHADVHSKPLGDVRFVFAVAPHHALASALEPLPDSVLRAHRAVAVADSVQRGDGLTIGLFGGQEVLTVASMEDKLQAQLRGLGSGFLPECMAREYIASGKLVVRQTERTIRLVRPHYAWRATGKSHIGQALQWWLKQLESAATRQALLSHHAPAV